MNTSNDKQPDKKYYFLEMLFLLVRLVANLPLKLQVMIGKSLGIMMLFLASHRRKVAETNLKLCFPELTDEQRRKLLKENFKLTGLALVETAACWFSNLKSRKARVKINGQVHLEEALMKNKGVILLSFHLTSLEIGGCLLGQYYPLSAMYKPNKNEFLEDKMTTGRMRHIDGLIKQNDVRSTVKALKANKIVWYATDQNYGTKSAVFVPFFGIQASTITATTKFAKLTGATIIPFTQSRSHDGTSFELTLHPPLTNIPGETEEADAITINAFLEGYLKQNPTDYMWLHQRFRTRPEGEPKIYPSRR